MTRIDPETLRDRGRRGITAVETLNYVDALESEVARLSLELATEKSLTESLEQIVKATANLREKT